jgi:hypothetical protein
MAFAEDQEEAMLWLRATPDERQKMWRPARLRERSGGRFRSSDHHRHCEQGGHPTPEATLLLPAHSRKSWPELSWLDLAIHGLSAWRYTADASHPLGYADQVGEVASTHGLRDAVTRWEQDDPLRAVADETIESFRRENETN